MLALGLTLGTLDDLLGRLSAGHVAGNVVGGDGDGLLADNRQITLGNQIALGVVGFVDHRLRRHRRAGGSAQRDRHENYYYCQ